MFFSKQDLYAQFTTVYTDFSEISFEKLHLRDIAREYNEYHYIRESKGNLFEYLIEPFRELQPKTYQQLIQGEWFYAIDKAPYPEIMSDITQLGIIVNEQRICYVHYTPYSYEKDREQYPTIPLELLNSWLYRSGGWDMAEATTINIYRGVLPSTNTYSMGPINTLCRLKDKNGIVLPQYTAFLEEKFNHPFRQSYQLDEFMDDKYFELRGIVDTRLRDDREKNGYQLFVSSHNAERNVYMVPRNDVMRIRKLSNPAEAIDAYAAHVLSCAEGEFDFWQYAEDF